MMKKVRAAVGVSLRSPGPPLWEVATRGLLVDERGRAVVLVRLVKPTELEEDVHTNITGSAESFPPLLL